MPRAGHPPGTTPEGTFCIFCFLSFTPRNPMDRIDPKTFRFQFPNLRYASGRKLCYLCFQVERDYFYYNDSDWGVFRNKVCTPPFLPGALSGRSRDRGQ